MTLGRLQSFLSRKPNARAFGANFGWLLADKVTRLMVAVFVSAWVARYLGPERYGILAYALAFVAMFQAIALLGLDNLVVRDASAHPAEAHRYLGTALRMRVGGALAAYCLMAVLSLTFNGVDWLTTVVVMLTGLSMLFQVSDVVDLWFQSQVQSRRTVLAKITAYLTTAGIKVIMILSGASLIAFAAANALETGLAAIGLYISYRRFRTQDRWRWDAGLAVSLFRQSWPLMLSGISILLYMRVSVIFLKETAGSAEVAIYSVGTNLSEMWYFIPMALASSLAPFISRKRMEGGEAYIVFLRKALCGMWYFSFLVASANALMSGIWVDLLYGAQYAGSARILSFHAFTFVPVCIGVTQNLWLINEGRSKLALYQAISGAIIALGLNLFLTPIYGAYGAVIATLASQFAQAFVINVILAPELFRLQLQSLRITLLWKS